MALDDKSNGILIYNGRSYAVGLLWFTVQEESGRDLLQQRIKKTHADFYCQRLHIAQQQAFGRLTKGHRRGMPVAAAMVADQLVGEWHGVFEADNGWWYMQVRSDTITPNGDRFFATEEEAFNTFQEEMSRHNWPHAYAPDKWRLGDRGIRELPLKNILDELVTTTLTPANLTAVFGSSSVRNIVLGGLSVVFAGMAAVAVYSLFLKPPPPAPIKRVSAAQIMAIRKSNDKQIVQVTSPLQLTQSCGMAADMLYQSLPGWRINKFNCNIGNASMSWQQVTGSLNDAKKAGRSSWPLSAKVTFLNRILTVTVPLEQLPNIEVPELTSQEDALLYLEQQLKPAGALQITTVIPPAPALPKRASSFLGSDTPMPLPKAPPAYLTIAYKSGFSPERIAPLLRPPGLEMQEVEWLIPQGLWQYKLKWYFKTDATAAPIIKPGVKPGANPVAAKAAPQQAAGGTK